MGINGKLLNWLRQRLSGRRQRTINNTFSKWVDVLSGVPQGSFLVPILFFTIINDIDSAASLINIILKFAEDTKSINQIEQLSDNINLQSSIDGMTEWAQKCSI